MVLVGRPRSSKGWARRDIYECRSLRNHDSMNLVGIGMHALRMEVFSFSRHGLDYMGEMHLTPGRMFPIEKGPWLNTGRLICEAAGEGEPLPPSGRQSDFPPK